MYLQPDRHRAHGYAGSHARHEPANRHTRRYQDFARCHEKEAIATTQSSKADRRRFAGKLLERAADTRNIRIAIDHCAAAGQAAGPNGLKPTHLDEVAKWKLAEILSPMIREGIYRPGKTRKKVLSKGRDRGTRTIQIQNFEDRIVERALLQIMRPLTQATFLDKSFGYRPYRSREDALLMAEQLAVGKGLTEVISQDFQDAFDRIPRNRAFQLLRKTLCADSENSFCNFVERVTATRGKKGFRQGGSVSPELLNVYLHWSLDQWWEREFPESALLRYADDILILGRPGSAQELHDALEQRSRVIGMRLKHSREEAITDLSEGAEAEWLGYGIRLQDDQLHVRIADKAFDKLEHHLEEAWEEPSPSVSVMESIRGWISSQGAAYQVNDVTRIYTRVCENAQESGFSEIPSREEFLHLWETAHQRDWVQRREPTPCPAECVGMGGCRWLRRPAIAIFFEFRGTHAVDTSRRYAILIKLA